MPTKTLKLIQFKDLRNVSTSSTMTEVETSQLKNWSTPSKPWALKIKPDKFWALSMPAQMLKIWTSPPSSTSSDSVETELLKPHWDNFLNISISTNKELSAPKNSKRLQQALDKTSPLLKSTKWLTTPIKTEMESSTTKNSLTLPPRNTPRYDDA